MSNLIRYYRLGFGIRRAFFLAFNRTIFSVAVDAALITVAAVMFMMVGITVLDAFAGRAHAQDALKDAKKLSIKQEKYVEQLQEFVAGCVSGQPFIYMEDDKAYVCISKRYTK